MTKMTDKSNRVFLSDANYSDKKKTKKLFSSPPSLNDIITTFSSLKVLIKLKSLYST